MSATEFEARTSSESTVDDDIHIIVIVATNSVLRFILHA